MPFLFTGSNTIFTSTAGSTAAVGTWYTIPSNVTELALQAVLTASSVGATAGSTVVFEVSNTTAIGSTGRSLALTCTTDTVSAQGSLISSMVAAWKLIRVNMVSLTSSTAGSAGSPSVTATVACRSVR